MHALSRIGTLHIVCGNHSVATARTSELFALAEEKGALFWKAGGMALQGCALILTGKASDAVHMITSAITAFRSMGVTLFVPLYLSHFARAYVELGKIDDAWRCIGEAMTAVETTKERWCEADIHRIAGEIALLVAGAGCSKSGSVFRPCARNCARAGGKVLGTARGDEHGAAVARSGQAAAGPRSSRSGLWLVHRRLRHARL